MYIRNVKQQSTQWCTRFYVETLNWENHKENTKNGYKYALMILENNPFRVLSKFTKLCRRSLAHTTLYTTERGYTTTFYSTTFMFCSTLTHMFSLSVFILIHCMGYLEIFLVLLLSTNNTNNRQSTNWSTSRFN